MKGSHTIIYVAATVATIALMLQIDAPRRAVFAFEDVVIVVTQSPATAYVYATKYFDVQAPEKYDLNRAEHFYKISLELDPSQRLVRHQLARIAFLRGQFTKALRLIDDEITIAGDNVHPSSMYVKGLIEGFMGRYADAARDYEAYLRTDDKNWAAINDYAWVLLKGKRYEDALIALDWGLLYWPQNPWLLNSKSTALYELKRYDEALAAATDAATFVQSVTPEQWSRAYPGNDPLIATAGVESFKKAVLSNIHTASVARTKQEKSVQ